MADTNKLLTFFKAMADANRLKIVGLLSKRSYTVEQLAAILGLGASTISHHLSKLSDAGLVSATAQSYYNYYSLNTEKIEAVGRSLLSMSDFPAIEDSLDVEAYDRQVLSNYLQPDGRLKTIPAQRKKLLIVLRHLVKEFAPGARYSEKEVNQALSKYHDDTASLRRELISAGLMARAPGGSSYWRVESEESKSD